MGIISKVNDKLDQTRKVVLKMTVSASKIFPSTKRMVLVGSETENFQSVIRCPATEPLHFSEPNNVKTLLANCSVCWIKAYQQGTVSRGQAERVYSKQGWQIVQNLPAKLATETKKILINQFWAALYPYKIYRNVIWGKAAKFYLPKIHLLQKYCSWITGKIGCTTYTELLVKDFVILNIYEQKKPPMFPKAYNIPFSVPILTNYLFLKYFVPTYKFYKSPCLLKTLFKRMSKRCSQRPSEHFLLKTMV